MQAIGLDLMSFIHDMFQLDSFDLPEMESAVQMAQVGTESDA